jgi:glycosyltransferase involved in cell wall biosynthesis
MRVLMVGSDPTERGGMATVTALMLKHRPDIRMVVTHREGPVVKRLWLWLAGTGQVVAALARRRVDVVHAHMSERGSVIRKGVVVLLAKAFRVPVVVHCHGAEFVEWFQGLPRPVQRIVAWTFRQADLFAVLGVSWRRTYASLLRVTRIAVLGNPVELPPVTAKPAGLRVVFLGRFGARKGSAAVLRAVAGLPVDVVMAGDGEVAETRALAAELGVRAEIHTWLAPADRDRVLASAHVFVLPSRDEGLPMALLEAMGHGLVPVVSPVGSIGEVVWDGENGMLVPPGDDEAIRQALEKLLADDGLRDRLSTSARATVEPYDIGPYMAGLAGHWDRISGSRAG